VGLSEAWSQSFCYFLFEFNQDQRELSIGVALIGLCVDRSSIYEYAVDVYLLFTQTRCYSAQTYDGQLHDTFGYTSSLF